MLRKFHTDGIDYLSYSYIARAQEELYETLESFDSLCNANGINYFLDGGSAIGAYRHEDFVPWDDDLDVAMIKKDYLRFINLANKNDNECYLHSSMLSNHCCSYYCKKGNYFFSYGNNRRGLSPIKIDIRPMNLIENNQQSIRKNRIYRELANYLIFGYCNGNYEGIVIDTLENEFNNSKEEFFLYYNTKYGLLTEEESALLTFPYMKYSTENYYIYSDVFPLKRIRFHGGEFSIPNSDIILRDLYGDYLKYPPFEERKPETTGMYYSENPQYYYDEMKRINGGLKDRSIINRLKWVEHILFELKRIN